MTGLIAMVPAVPVLIFGIAHMVMVKCWDGVGRQIPGTACVALLDEWHHHGTATKPAGFDTYRVWAAGE